MTTAKEATAMSNLSFNTKVNRARMKANDVMDIIDQYIVICAQNGDFSTTVHPLKLYNFNTEVEQRAYMNQVRENLETNGYTIKFHPSEGALEIKWPYV